MSNTQSSHPLVSVIIPAYNAEHFLPSTLVSAQQQTYNNFEIVVVNDGSTDATSLILEETAKKDERVRFINQPHAGVAAARNRAIMEARGTYIAPLDADDAWHPDNLTLQIAALQRAGATTAVSYAWFVVIDEFGGLINLGPPNKLSQSKRVLAAQIKSNFIGNASSTVMRRDAVEAAGGYDRTLRDRNGQGCEDQGLYIALAEKWDFTIVPQYLVAYRSHPGSMCRDAAQMSRSQALVLADLRRRRPDLPGYLFGRGFAAVHESDLMLALGARNWRNALRVLARSLDDSAWGLLYLTTRRLPYRVVNSWLYKLGLNGEPKMQSLRPVDVFWPVNNDASLCGITNATVEKSGQLNDDLL
jgi:glycosyltransferase involved in cell wall biosynthesis